MSDEYDGDFDLQGPALRLNPSPVKSESVGSQSGFEIRHARDNSAFSDADEEEDWDKSHTLKASGPQLQALKQLSALKGQATGTVQHLGTTRIPQHASDWDEDLDFLGAGSKLQQPLRQKSSFASQLSIEGEDDQMRRPASALSRARPSSALSDPYNRPKSSTSSLASRREEPEEHLNEDDFDLPADLARVTLSSSRTKPRTATLSSSSNHSRDSSLNSTSGDNSSRSKLFLSPESRGSSRPRTSTTTISSSNSFSDFDNEDANFFDDLVLPSYLLGQKEASQESKVDLKSLIEQNLKARMEAFQEPELTPEASSARLVQRLQKRKHAERPTELYEEGLIITEDSFSRTRGTMRPPSRQPSIVNTPKDRPKRKSSGKTNITNLFAPPTSSRTTSTGRISPQPPATTVRSVSTRRVSSNVAGTSQPARIPSNEGRTLRYKKSTPHLPSASAGSSEAFPPMPHARTLSRKQSMPSLSDITVTAVPPRLPRSHTPTSYGSSAQSAKPRRPPSQPVNPINPSKAFLQQRELSASPTIPPARPSTPAGSGAGLRLTMPTLSSRLKQRSVSTGPSASDPTGRTSAILLGTTRSSMMSPSSSSSSISNFNLATSPTVATQILKRPRKSRSYGDGTELDAFDDLPTNKDKERRYTASSAIIKRQQTRFGSAFGLNTIPGSPATVQLKKGVENTAKRKKGEKRVMPQLIRNLTASGTQRVEGDMVWNPLLQRWEGNEGALRAFDNVMASSVRPALITQLSANSPVIRRASTQTNSSNTPGLGGVRVVGDMIFDPVKMCWFSQATEGEEELDFGDDEAEIDWTPSTDTVRLKSKASFLNYSEATSLGSSSQRGVSETSFGMASTGQDEFWAACKEAETRHRMEMRNWQMNEAEASDRAYLWSIRKIVMKERQ